MKKRVWLDLNSGEFSIPWDVDKQMGSDEEIIEIANNANATGEFNYKLIEFECLNDSEFTFNQLMSLK